MGLVFISPLFQILALNEWVSLLKLGLNKNRRWKPVVLVLTVHLNFTKLMFGIQYLYRVLYICSQLPAINKQNHEGENILLMNPVKSRHKFLILRGQTADWLLVNFWHCQLLHLMFMMKCWMWSWAVIERVECGQNYNNFQQQISDLACVTFQHITTQLNISLHN